MQRRVTPVMVDAIVQIGDSLRTFVTEEIREAKDAIARARSPRLEPARSPLRDGSNLPLTDDTVRKLLHRMRTMMEEERFRSGKIR